LGSHVIYASFDKLVISTSKTNFKIGGAYSAYLLHALQKNVLFEHLELKPVKFWDYLIWLDPYNYGGLVFDETEEQFISVSNPSSVAKICLDMNWDISEYLPPVAREEFDQVISNFILIVEQLKNQDNTNFAADLAETLGSDIKRKLYGIISEMHKRHFIKAGSDQNVDESLAFPSKPGCCRPLKNASLEFIKMITAVFELDSNLLYEARLLKRDLLKIIGYAEFSGEATFTNPCEPYVLSQVICDYCNISCDLDLTRQREDLGNDPELGDSTNFLVCSACNTEYDREDIEQRLIEDVQNIICKWQLQDLRCKRCRLVKAEDLREQCASCKGSIQTMIDYGGTMRQIGVLKNLSIYFQMEILEEVLSFL
jgi:DNA polymerase epsilon subunit 1